APVHADGVPDAGGGPFAGEDRGVRPRPDPSPHRLPRPAPRTRYPGNRLRAIEDHPPRKGSRSPRSVLRRAPVEVGRGVGVEARPVPGGGPPTPLLPPRGRHPELEVTSGDDRAFVSRP